MSISYVPEVTLAPDMLCVVNTWVGLAPRLEPSSAVMLLVFPHVSRIIHVSALQSRGRTCLWIALDITRAFSLTKCQCVSASALRRLARPHTHHCCWPHSGSGPMGGQDRLS